MRKLLAGATMAASAVWLAAGSAGADPLKQDAATLTCGNNSYQVVVNGNGEFTPAHDLGSTSMFIPVAFGEFTGTILDPDGNVVDSFTEPAGAVKGKSGKDRKGLMECSYSINEVNDGADPEFPAGYTFTGEGAVTVKMTPAN